MATKQTNITANPARHLVFFEGEELCYNYKTGQWSRLPAYDGYGMYSLRDLEKEIGLVVYSSGSVDLQDQSTSDPVQAACLSTQVTDPNPGGRTVVTGVRPLMNGGTPTVRVGSKDDLSDSVDWSSAVSLNSRTGVASFRKEGRYVAASVEFTDDFNVLLGLEMSFESVGRV